MLTWDVSRNQAHPDGGAFGEYAVVKGDLQIKIPDNLSFEEAATLGVGVSTVVSLTTKFLRDHAPADTS